MRILANENLPSRLIEALRAREHDVVWARTEMPGASDRAMVARAQKEGRIIITQDKDFGELAFRLGLLGPCGIVLVRVSPLGPEALSDSSCRCD